MKLRHILIVGGGGIGERHLRVFGRLPGVETSLCEPRSDKTQELQSRYPVKRLFNDFNSLDLSQFDATVICAPTHWHVEMATRAAQQGCPFLLEKPLSTSLEGCDDLIELVEGKPVTAGVAYVMRHCPAIKEMKCLIDKGDIGEVRTITLEGGQYFPAIRPDYNHNYFSRYATGGGVLLDFMSHGINLVEWMNGRETEVSCFSDQLQLKDIETDDVGMFTARYENGSLAHIQQDAFRRDLFLHITVVGSEGTLLFEHERHRMGHYPAAGSDWHWQDYTCERDDFFTAQARGFLKAFDGEEPVRCTLREAKWTLQVVLAARLSAQEQRHVILPT